MNKLKLFLLTLLFPPLLVGMEINSDILRKNPALAHAKVIYDKERFIVDEDTIIQRSNMNKELRALSDPQIKSMLNKKEALLYLRKLSDNNYSLELQGKIKGGGIISGAIGYWGTKVFCYTAAIFVAGTAGAAATAATGGTAAPAVATAVGIHLSAVGGGAAAFIAGVESSSLAIGTSLLVCPFLP